MSQPPFGTSGELAQGPLGDPNDWVPVTGDGGGPSDAGSATVATPMQPPVATPMQTPAATPTLQKTTVSAATASNNGGFNWGVRWSIQNASNATNGWIVQNVAVAQTVTDAKGVPVVPGQGTYGGLSTSWYPLWEAWQVRGGQVFVGGSTSPHNADTYAQNAVGATTKGKTEVTGRADFFPTLTLPTAFAVTNSAPSWALPATTTDPKLTGGTGALDHNLTATWDGVGGPGTTTVTTA